MSSSASPAPSRRKTPALAGRSGPLLTGIVVFIFREHWAEISGGAEPAHLRAGGLALAVGLSYPLLEGVSSWLIVRSRLPHFPTAAGHRQRMDGDLRQCGGPRRRVGAVSDVVSPPARAGRRPRRGADDPAMRPPQDSRPALRHRRLLAGRPWMAAHSDGVLCGICPGPTLSWQASSWGSSPSARCRWCRVWPGGCCIFCPTRAAGPSARESWLEQLDTLSTESRHLLADKPRCAAILGVHLVKLFLLFCLPWMGLRSMGLDTGLAFWQVQTPHVADPSLSQRPAQRGGHGLGGDGLPAGVQQLPPDASSMSLLMFYRLASYYAVFAASAVGFGLQRRLDRG